MYENDGPRQAKLFKFLRKVVIKKLFIYKEEIYRINKLFYLLNLTMFNTEMARIRWIRQMVRKWRFLAFMKNMAKKKMELMYKNLHVSYLEMVNTIFSDSEKINPSVIKEFERFGYGIGMFVNEDPNTPSDGNLCLGVKKKYLFQPIGLKKTFQIKKKIVEKEMKEEQYISDIKGKFTSSLDSKHSKSISMTGKEEYNYDDSYNKDQSSSLKKEDKIESKSKSKLKAHYSTKPLEKKEENEEEEYEEEEKEAKEEMKDIKEDEEVKEGEEKKEENV